MGYGALNFQEIDAWQRATALNLTAWEVLTLRKLSIAYVNELHLAEKPDRPPPYMRELEVEEKQAVNNQVANSLRAFAQLQKGGR